MGNNFITHLDLPSCATENVCSLAGLLHDMRKGANDDLEEQTRVEWEKINDRAEASGDGLDYDGPLTWARME